MPDLYQAGEAAPSAPSRRCSPAGARILLIAVLLVLVTLSHWMAPTDRPSLHVLHIVHMTLQKMFVLPILLAAAWFTLPGALAAAVAATVLYLPYVLSLPAGVQALDQGSEMVNFWIVAVIGGLFLHREKVALEHAARVTQGTLESLVSALDAREHKTEQHSLRVRDLAERVAKEMGLAAKNKITVRQAALLHDVGKIGVPDATLLKPDLLTDQEAAAMRQHAAIGYRVIRVVPGLHEAADAIHAHHEWFDGSGYPRRLKGGQIPLVARILAVADVYDALTSDRPYRAAMSTRQAAHIIQSEQGTHFDPAVVDALLRVVQPALSVQPAPDWTGAVDRQGDHVPAVPESLSQRIPAPPGGLRRALA